MQEGKKGEDNHEMRETKEYRMDNMSEDIVDEE